MSRKLPRTRPPLRRRVSEYSVRAPVILGGQESSARMPSGARTAGTRALVAASSRPESLIHFTPQRELKNIHLC